MAWGTTDVTRIRINATNYDFAPNALKLLSVWPRRKNQVVQESESGEVKILTLSDTEIRILEFAVDRMPAGTYTAGSLSLTGFGTLHSLITGSGNMNYRGTTCEIWLPGTSKAGSSDGNFRYWSDTIDMPLFRYGASLVYYGDGSQILRFRKEV
jgi:hypothetical protein